jgi:hypothetical protein
MSSLHNENLELQIKITELQTEVQINLSISIGLVALFVALMISFQQLYVNATALFTQLGFLSGMLASAFLAPFSMGFFIKRMYDKRDEIKELKKQYVW